jgi:hypothetical protein
MTKQNATLYHYVSTSPSIRLSNATICKAFTSPLPYNDTPFITALKWKWDSSVNRTSVRCICNHHWVHCSRFCRLITVKLLRLNGHLVWRSIDRSPCRTVDAERYRLIIPCICCVVCVDVGNWSRRWRNWMRRSLFRDVTLPMPWSGLPLMDQSVQSFAPVKWLSR